MTRNASKFQIYWTELSTRVVTPLLCSDSTLLLDSQDSVRETCSSLFELTPIILHNPSNKCSHVMCCQLTNKVACGV